MNDSAPTLDEYATQLADAARDAGHALARSAQPHEWADGAAQAINRLAASHVEFTAEDVTKIVGPGPGPGSVGAAIRKASVAGQIFVVGFARSKRPSRRGGLQLTWRGR